MTMFIIFFMVKCFIIFLLDSIPLKCISRRTSSFYFTKKTLFNVVLISWDNIAQVKTLYKIVQSKRLQTTLDRKKSCSILF